MKQFVKSLDKEGDTFKYLKAMFPNISDKKLEEGVFVGPQIRKAIKSNIKDVMTKEEKEAWDAFVDVCGNFLGKKETQKLRTWLKI